MGLDLPKGRKELPVGDIFPNGTKLKDSYSNHEVEVIDGKVIIDNDFDIVLLEKI